MKATSTKLKALHLTRPTLILDRAQTEQNIGAMVDKAKRANVRLRPHFKTHQSADIGALFRERGVTAITCSSLDMAAYFAEHGWNDITVAIPINPLEIDKINSLAAQITLNLLVDSEAAVAALAGLQHPVNLWIEADVGYHRTGLPDDNPPAVLAVAHAIATNPKLRLDGLLTHAGHSYTARTRTEVAAVHEESIGRLRLLQSYLSQNGVIGLALSVGDTPTASIMDIFPDVAEIRPGNFVFHDLMQVQIWDCPSSAISVAVACPVIGKYPERERIVIHGGGVHFSKEVLVELDGRHIYGYATTLEEDENGTDTFSGIIPAAPLISLSQEHGTLHVTDSALFDEIEIGDFLLILPVHSCMTVDLFNSYTDLNGRTYSRIGRQP